MATRSAQLAARREALLARSTTLRLALVDNFTDLAGRLHTVDRASAFLRSFAGRALLFGGLALLALAGPRRALALTGRAAAVWSLLRMLRPMLLAFGRRSHRA
jgi:hypothetical protein